MLRREFQHRALSLTPLVDVIFLLLLFFMLTSTFSRYSEIEIAAATGGGVSAAVEGAKFLQLGPDRLRLAGQEIAQSALPGALTGATVLVSLDEGVTAQRLIDLITLLRPVPDLSLTVLR